MSVMKANQATYSTPETDKLFTEFETFITSLFLSLSLALFLSLYTNYQNI